MNITIWNDHVRDVDALAERLGDAPRAGRPGMAAVDVWEDEPIEAADRPGTFRN